MAKHSFFISKHPIKKLAITLGSLTAAGILLSSVPNIANSMQPSATENTQNGFETNISQNTISQLSELQQLIESAEHGDVAPTQATLEIIIDRLDGVNTDIVKDLTLKAYSEKHPEYSNISVTPEYTETTTDGRVDSIFINYNDENNEEKIEHVKNMDLNLKMSFDQEQKYKDLRDKVSNIFEDSSLNYVEKAQRTKSLLKEFHSIYEYLDKLGGMEFQYEDGILFMGPSIKTTDPEKLDDTQNTDLQNDNKNHNDNDER